MNISIISSILSLFIGIIYTVLALALPKASIGSPHEPKIFPMGLGIILIIISFILLIQELFKQNKQKREIEQDKQENSKDRKKFKLDNDVIKILLTSLFALIYALLFNRLGYVISTVIFLQSVLWLFNGFKDKKWILNTIISVVFGVSVYILFSVILGVYLPPFPKF